MIGLLTDIDSGDLQIACGTLVIGDNAEQIAECVLRATRGDFKEYPLIGAEIVKLRNGNIDLMWCATARDMLHACGLQINQVKIENNIITIV